MKLFKIQLRTLGEVRVFVQHMYVYINICMCTFRIQLRTLGAVRVLYSIEQGCICTA